MLNFSKFNFRGGKALKNIVSVNCFVTVDTTPYVNKIENYKAYGIDHMIQLFPIVNQNFCLFCTLMYLKCIEKYLVQRSQ